MVAGNQLKGLSYPRYYERSCRYIDLLKDSSYETSESDGMSVARLVFCLTQGSEFSLAK